jgi:hypothetical protein
MPAYHDDLLIGMLANTIGRRAKPSVGNDWAWLALSGVKPAGRGAAFRFADILSSFGRLRNVSSVCFTPYATTRDFSAFQ